MRPRLLTTLFLLIAVLAVVAALLYRHTSRYDFMISQAAARENVDFYLVKALVFEESWFRPDIRGSSGELGLMQISRAAAADFASKRGLPPFYEARLLEPELNLEIGCWYLRQSLDRYKDSPSPEVFALLRYNAGAIRADAWLKAALLKPVPPGMSAERYDLSLVDLPQTREYVRRILNRWRSRNFWF
jgi:soluble lytic murein transglycosylase